jgi:hypothetical protein
MKLLEQRRMTMDLHADQIQGSLKTARSPFSTYLLPYVKSLGF